MKVKGTFFLIFLLISPLAVGQKEVYFDAQAALSYIRDLSSEAMMGRESGQPGGDLSEEYIASRLKEWGVEPGGDNGTYFQKIVFEHIHIEPKVSLEIITGRHKRNFPYEDGWRVWPYSGLGHFEAEIVFVGYGIHSPQKGYDDFAGMNLEGKVALLILETPFQLEEMIKEELEIQKRIKAVQESGALAVLICPSPVKGNRRLTGDLGKDIYQKDFVILRIENRIAEFIFRDLPLDLTSLIEEIDSSAKPRLYETGVKASVAVNAFFDEKRTARNVLGKITGSDRKLKDEYVFVAAHIDHLGINPDGEVMPGANDNASGTSVAMEVARILKFSKAKLKRTIVFFLWAAEEQGYKGLQYYSSHPIFPLEKIVAHINMDMVGHGSGKVKISGIDYRPDLWNLLKENIPKDILDNVKPLETFSARLPVWDPLVASGVARFGLQTEGYHLKYHQSRDKLDLIKPELLKRTGEFVLSAILVLANNPGNLIPGFRRENYYLKVLRPINFASLSLKEIVEFPERAKNSEANLQLAILEGEKDLEGDSLRVDLAKKIFTYLEEIKRENIFSLFSTRNQLESDIRHKKMTIILGLRGMTSFLDNPLWASVLAKLGCLFIIEDKPSFLFTHGELNETGRKVVTALNESGLLLLICGLNNQEARALLENSKKPLVLLQKDLPDPEILNLLKNKGSAFGLLLGKEDSLSYFQKLDEARKAIGSEYLILVNEESIQGEGKGQILRLISEILKANYEWKDIFAIFSETFLKLLDEGR